MLNEVPVTDIEVFVRLLLFNNRELKSENSRLESELSNLSLELANLRMQLSAVQSPSKNSCNSSIPPSQDDLQSQSLRRTKTLREKNDRSTGGQKGHKGTTLAFNDDADITINHPAPEVCSHCGGSLYEITAKVLETRQSIDIPLPICPVITNHVIEGKKCNCGFCYRGKAPDYVKTGVSYGINIHALVAYLSTVQHIPFKRFTQVLLDIYDLGISQGSVANILNRMRKQSKPHYEDIRQEIKNSQVVGADETSERLNGQLHWMWVFQNKLATYAYQDPFRGKLAIDKHFPNGLPKATLVTNRHRSYCNMEVAGHQLCLPYLLRELTFFCELDKEQEWSSNMLYLLRESIYKRKSLEIELIDVEDIKERMDKLLEEDISHLHPKMQTFQKSLTKYKEYLLQFLANILVPSDNNASYPNFIIIQTFHAETFYSAS